MAIARSIPRPISGANLFQVKSTVGTHYAAHSAHTKSMLAQAARVPRLANISSVRSALSAHGKSTKR